MIKHEKVNQYFFRKSKHFSVKKIKLHVFLKTDTFDDRFRNHR